MDLFARKLEGRKEGQGKKVDYHRGIALTHTKTLFKDNTSPKKGFESQPYSLNPDFNRLSSLEQGFFRIWDPFASFSCSSSTFYLPSIFSRTSILLSQVCHCSLRRCRRDPLLAFKQPNLKALLLFFSAALLSAHFSGLRSECWSYSPSYFTAAGKDYEVRSVSIFSRLKAAITSLTESIKFIHATRHVTYVSLICKELTY